MGTRRVCLLLLVRHSRDLRRQRAQNWERVEKRRDKTHCQRRTTSNLIVMELKRSNTCCFFSFFHPLPCFRPTLSVAAILRDYCSAEHSASGNKGKSVVASHRKVPIRKENERVVKKKKIPYALAVKLGGPSGGFVSTLRYGIYLYIYIYIGFTLIRIPYSLNLHNQL